MVGYETIEAAVVAKFVEKFPELSASRCRAGDPDGVFGSIFEEGVEYGCWFEFNGGGPDVTQPFKHQIWMWRMDAVFAIQLSDDIEAKMRDIVTRIATVFQDDHTLGGVTPRVRIVQIDGAVPAEVNNTPFYWIGFSVDAFDA